MTRRHVLSRPLPPRSRFLARLGRSVTTGFVIIGVSLTIGVLGYRFFENLPWLDAVLEASMILSGMGPIQPPTTAAGKVFGSLYALFSGVVFISVAAVVLAPALHRLIHQLHLEAEEAHAEPSDRALKP